MAPAHGSESKAVSRFAQAAPRALTPAELDEVDDASHEWRRATSRRLLLRGAAWSRRLSEANGIEYCVVERDEPVRVEQLTIWGGVRVRILGTRKVEHLVKLGTLYEHHHYPHRITSWHEQRALSVSRGIRRKVARCGERELACACRRCGKHHLLRSRCDDRLCSPCSTAFFSRLRKRLMHASMAWLGAHSRRGRRLTCPACEHCGRNHPAHAVGRPRVQLWTLTVAHGETAAVTRERITRAWVRLRATLYWQLGYALPYALVWEWTKGTGAHGAHVHAHVLTVAPPLCYRELSRWWSKAARGQSAGIGHPRARRGKGVVSATSAARYIAKYASKGSGIFEGEAFDPVLTAEVWTASYARRRVTASVGFWVRSTRITPCCLAPWVVLAGWGALAANDTGPASDAPARAPPVDEWANTDARLKLAAARERMRSEQWLLGLRGLRRTFAPRSGLPALRA